MISKASILTNQKAWLSVAIAFLVGNLLLSATPAIAHHPFGGETPKNFFEGFVSGIGHPLLGPDHFAFIVAIGLLAALKKQGIIIPTAFVLASLAGTGIHLLSLNLPAPELFISASVLIIGAILAMKSSPNLIAIALLATVSGLFHGYAYGEAIVGAEMTPLLAYLAGFTCIQLAIALLAYALAKSVARTKTELPMREAGFTILGVGAAFLSAVVLG